MKLKTEYRILHLISAFLWDDVTRLWLKCLRLTRRLLLCLRKCGTNPLKSLTHTVFRVLKIIPSWHFRQIGPLFVQVTKYFSSAPFNLKIAPTGFRLHKEAGQLISCGLTVFEYRTWAFTEKKYENERVKLTHKKV